ncbi:MAG: phasin family protein [Undibacterium sp.]|uniref:phasin family protein n=1 Tax=Undibacterium sp. TaxID=1914977 RepID=UPI002726617F|nr:phasin family protein [Undibacterium sp.]MDO8650609.1 phasin family protein [Undibacterium sp.]
MEKKLKTLAKVEDEKLADAVLASAQQIWQAGLGAFAIAEAEGGKLFGKLVKEGTDIQKRTRRLAGIKVSDVTESVTQIAGNVGKQASGSWDKIEQVFEDRVSRTLATLGVPTSRDIRALTERIEDLSNAVAALSVNKPLVSKTAATLATKGPAVVKATPKTVPKAAPKKSVKKSAAAVKTMDKPAVAKRAAAKPATAKPATAKLATAKPVVAKAESSEE